MSNSGYSGNIVNQDLAGNEQQLVHGNMRGKTTG